LRLEAAIQLFKDGQVPLGRSAEMAGLTRWQFEAIIADRSIKRVVPCDSDKHLERHAEALRRNEQCGPLRCHHLRGMLRPNDEAMG
jgi:predicted HTH domain antitoxin